MEPNRIQETVVPTDRTLDDVLAAGAAELDQYNFVLAANAAENVAVKAKLTTDIYKQNDVFDAELVANCKRFGDDIPRRVTVVIYSSAAYLVSPKPHGERLKYASTGTDGNIFVAYVYP